MAYVREKRFEKVSVLSKRNAVITGNFYSTKRFGIRINWSRPCSNQSSQFNRSQTIKIKRQVSFLLVLETRLSKFISPNFKLFFVLESNSILVAVLSGGYIFSEEGEPLKIFTQTRIYNLSLI